MRYILPAKLLSLSILAPMVMFGQLSITNYQLVSSTGSNYTYTAQLNNTGVALGSVTATAAGLNPFAFRTEPGQNTLNFAPVPANGQVTSSNTFTILVTTTPVNWANIQWTFQSTPAGPVANAGPNQTAGLHQTVTLDGSGSTNPSGVGNLTYAWSFVSRPAGSSTILSNQGGVHPTFFVDVMGTYVVRLTVSNGTSSSSATVTVSTGDTAPVANAGPNQTVAPGATVTLNGSGSTDSNSDPLTYQWTLTTVPAGSAAVLSSATAVNPTFVADKVGTYVAQLVVNDGTLNSAPATVTISDTTPPVANAGSNQVVTAGSKVQLDGSGSTDVDGNPLTYSWNLITRPGSSTATLSSATSVQPTFTADVQGTYVAQLIVHDGAASSAPATVQITTNPPLAPTANAGQNQVIPNPGATVQLSGTASTDPQGYPLTYQWSFNNVPTGSKAALSPNSTSGTPSFVADLPGTYIAQLIVNDGYSSSAPATVTITTNPANPTANAGSPQTVAIASTVTLNGTGSSDPNDQPLTYSWTFNSKPAGSAAMLTGANTATPTFVPDVAGLYVAQLIVSDSFLSSTPVTVNVTASAQAAIILQSGIVLSAGGQTTLSISLSSPAPGPGGLFVTLNSNNSSVTLTPSNGVVVIPAGKSGPVTVNVNGVSFGSATITAVAQGFTTASTTVSVSDILSFTPSTRSITGETMQEAYLLLSGSAPTAITVNLSSSNPSVATVPATATFMAGTNNINVPVTGVSGGTAVIHASSAANNLADTTLNVTVTALEVTTTELNTGLLGAPYSQTLTATNGTTPYTWALISGTLPAGMTFSSAGALGGTPTAITPTSGVSLTFRVADSSSPEQFATVTLTLTVVVGTPASITATGGTPQSAGATAAFATPLSATVKDVNGFLVPNVTVTFTILPVGGAGGTFTGGGTTAAIQTNSSGVATAPLLTANGVLGTYSVSAAVSPVTTQAAFSLTNVVGAPATLTVTSGSGQSATEGTAFANPLVVTVKDGGGNLVPGAVVNFTSTNGTLTVNTATATPSGVATLNNVVAGGKAGPYTITATSGTASTTFSLTSNVGAPATITTTSGSPQSVAANTAFGSPLVAIVKDSGGNILPGVQVTFTAPTTGPSVTFTPASGVVTTDANGNATVSVKANGSASSTPYNVYANVSGVATAASFQLTNLTGPPASITMVSGSGQTAGITTAFAAQLVAVVKDSGGNLVTGATVTFTAPTGTGVASATFTTATAVTDVNGNATKIAIANTVVGGPYTVTATVAGGFSATFSLTNVVGPPNTIKMSTGSPQNAAISTAFGTNLVVLVSDIGGNPVPNATVTFTAPALTGASGTFASGTTTAVTNSNGLATAASFTANGVAGGPYNVAATVTGVSTAANFALTNLVGTPASITVKSGSPQTASEGKAFASALVALVTDSGGNPIPNVSVTFQAPSSGASATFAGNVTTEATNAAGLATSAILTANGTYGGPYSVTATVSGSNPAITTSFSLMNNAGPPASIAVSSGSAQSATAGSAFALPLQATVTDSGGNPVSGASVTFTVAPGTTGASGTFAGAVGTTNSSGVATSGVLTANKTSGNFTVTASVTGASPAITTGPAFTLTNNAGVAAAITATGGSGQTAPIGTAFGLPLTATVKDANGNLVSGATVTFTAPSTGPSGTFANATTTATASTGTNGQAVSPIFTANSSSSSSSYNVFASVNGVTVNFALTNGPGVPASVAVYAGNNQTVPIGSSYAPLSVKVADAFGNPVATGTTVTFTVVPGAGNAGATVTGSNTATTSASGIATTSWVLSPNAVLGAFTVTAAASTGTAATFNLTNIPGQPNTITPSTSAQSAQILQPFGPLSVTVLDPRGHDVANTVQVTFTASTVSGATGTFAGGASSATVFTNNGVATVPAFTANSTIGTYTLTAAVTATPTLSTSFTMTNTVGPPAAITVYSGSGQSATVGATFASAIVVKVTDAGGNTVPSTPVTFAAPTGTGIPTGTFGTVTTMPATTGTTGLAQVPAGTFKAGTMSGTYNLTATATAGTAPSVTIAMINNPGPASSIAVTSGSSQSAELIQAFALPLVATVKDANGNLVSSSTSVTFTAPSNGASGTFGTGNSATATVNTVSGVATSPAFTANRIISPSGTPSYNVVASVAGASPAITTNFALTNLVGAPATITASAAQSVQVGQAFAPLTATIKDVAGNLVQGAVVTFTAPTTAGVASGTFTGGANTATTNAQGVATINFKANTVASATAYNVAVSVTPGTATPVNISLTNLPGAAANVAATSATPSQAPITTNYVLVATVTDQYNNPVPSVPVVFQAPAQTGASGLFSGALSTSVNTNASGMATATMTANTNLGQFKVTATVSGGASATFQLTNLIGPVASLVATSGNNQSATVGAAFATPFAVTATDAGGNLVPNAVVTFKAAALVAGVAGGSFPGNSTTATATTISSGVATTTSVFTANTTASTTGNPYTVTASVGTFSATFSLTNNAGPATSVITYQWNPESTFVNEPFANPLQALVRDTYGNPINGALVTFTPPAGNVPSATFAAGVNTAVSKNGLAVSGLLSANGLAGSAYNVVASAAGATSANFALTNTVNSGGSSGTFTLTPGVVNGNLTVGTNMEILVNLNVSPVWTCLQGPSSINVFVTADDTNLFVADPQGIPVACGSGVATFRVQAGPNTGTFPLTVQAPGYTTNNSSMITVTPSGYIVSSTQAAPYGTTINTFEGLSSTLYVYPVQLDSSNNVVALATPASNVSLTLTVANPALGTISTSPVSILGGGTTATATFVAAPSLTGATNITITQPGSHTPNTNTSISVNIAQGSIVPPSATVGLNLEAPISLSLNGAAPGPCGGEGTTPFTVTSNSSNLLFSSNSAGPAGPGLNSITVPIQNCGTTSLPFYAQVVGGSAGSALTYSVTGGGFPTATGTITVAASGFVIAATGNNPGSVPYEPSTAGGPTVSFTVLPYSLDVNKNPVALQAIAPGLSGNVTQVTVPVQVDNTTYGSLSANSVAIPSGTTAGATFTFQGLVGGSSSNPNIANVSVSQPSLPAGFTIPGSDTSIPVKVADPGFYISASNSNITASVGQYLQVSGTISIGLTPPANGQPLTLSIAGSQNGGNILLSATGTDAGQSTALPLTILPGSNNTVPFFVYGLSTAGSVTITASAPNYTSQNFTITLTPSGVALVGNFQQGSAQYLQTSANPATLPQFQVETGQVDSSGDWLGAQALMPILEGSPLSMSVHLNTSSAPGTISPSSPVTIQGGTAGTAVTFTPSMDGNGSISISSATNAVLPSPPVTVSGQSSMTVQVVN